MKIVQIYTLYSNLPKFCKKKSVTRGFAQFAARNGIADGRYRLRPSLVIAPSSHPQLSLNPALQMLPLV